MAVIVQEAAFDPGQVLTGFDAGGAGAVVTFTGVVRGEGDLTGMMIEHYPGMTERAIGAMVNEAKARWTLTGALVIHRHGLLQVGEPIMMVVTAASHRVAAFEAAEFLMDYLKSRAPFWKKELGQDEATWVAATAQDEAALRRW
jgi:molybdopterin synthase catalytic subunit